MTHPMPACRTWLPRLLGPIVCAGLTVLSHMAHAQSDCRHRGELDVQYCDADHNLVADAPRNPQQLKDPPTLAFSYSAVENAEIYEKIFRPFTAHLAQCIGRPVVYQRVQSNAAEIEAMRLGRLHVAGFSTGPTRNAVNQAGAVPFAIKGSASGAQGYHLILIVKKASPIQTLADLKGKRVAHVQPTSNSGNLAPRALFPALGLTPDRDYRVLYSGKHDNSIAGVLSGEYDAAPVASGVFERMATRGQINKQDLRILWRSDLFPSTSFAYAHDLAPPLREAVVKCFFAYLYPAEMQKVFNGADRFLPISYLKDWEIVRKIAAFSDKKTLRHIPGLPPDAAGAKAGSRASP